MGRVWTGRLYIRYSGAAPKKWSRGVQKILQTTSLGCSNAKFTLFVVLTFVKLRKPNMKISILFIFFLSPSPSCLTQKQYGVFEYKTYQMIALQMEMIPTCLKLCVSYNWQVMATKLPERRLAFSVVHLLASHALIVWVWYVWSGHTRTTECMCYRLRQVC